MAQPKDIFLCLIDIKYVLYLTGKHLGISEHNT